MRSMAHTGLGVGRRRVGVELELAAVSSSNEVNSVGAARTLDRVVCDSRYAYAHRAADGHNISKSPSDSSLTRAL